MMATRDVVRRHTSLPTRSLGARARYLPSRSATRILYAPESFVRIVAMVRQVPFTNRWIFTATSSTHAANPSLAVTAPLATRCRRRNSEIDR